MRLYLVPLEAGDEGDVYFRGLFGITNRCCHILALFEIGVSIYYTYHGEVGGQRGSAPFEKRKVEVGNWPCRCAFSFCVLDMLEDCIYPL